MLEVVEEEERKLFGRKDIKFKVKHPESGTPSRNEVIEALIKTLKIEPEKLFLEEMHTPRGSNETLGIAYVFKEEIRSHLIEPRLRRKLRETTVIGAGVVGEKQDAAEV